VSDVSRLKAGPPPGWNLFCNNIEVGGAGGGAAPKTLTLWRRNHWRRNHRGIMEEESWRRSPEYADKLIAFICGQIDRIH